MYEDHFGLERPPFRITPDTSLFYEGGKRGDILAALVYAVQRGEGIVKVVGEVGSGKTMLCRMLQLRLPDNVEIVYIANPSVSPEDILFVIAHELSLEVGRDSSKHEVMHALQDYLLERHTENKQVVLFVEEAQGMPIETLEEIRLLSNLETDQHKLLQIILFGQPELDQNLAQKSIRQLRERITHNFNLEPLTRDEIHNYLNFRMREVGYTGPELISLALAKKIELHSEGLLRRINIIADKILLSAFAEGTHNLVPKHVAAAVEDSAFNTRKSRNSESILLWLLGITSVMAVLVALYQTWPLWNWNQAGQGEEKRQDAAIIDKSITDIGRPDGQTGKNVQATKMEFPVVQSDEGGARDSKAGQTKLPEQVPAGPDGMRDGKADQSLQVSGSAVEQGPLHKIPDDEASRSADAAGLDSGMIITPKQSGNGLAEPAVQLAAQAVARAMPVSARNAPAAAPVSGETPPPDDMTPRAGETPPGQAGPVVPEDPQQWLTAKLEESLDWLRKADRGKVSIQVMMLRKSEARELVYYLRNEWPLDISKTYLYEVNIENRSIYRVFYSEFDSLAMGRQQLEKLPDAVKINSPYLHSVYRMQKALL